MIKVIEVQRIIVPCRGEGLIRCHDRGGDVRFKIDSFQEASDELLQRDIQTVAREVAMIGEAVDSGTRTATCRDGKLLVFKGIRGPYGLWEAGAANDGPPGHRWRGLQEGEEDRVLKAWFKDELDFCRLANLFDLGSDASLQSFSK